MCFLVNFGEIVQISHFLDTSERLLLNDSFLLFIHQLFCRTIMTYACSLTQNNLCRYRWRLIFIVGLPQKVFVDFD